jgi:peroxiredoxin (alkyl hydroperoxide reductase subunit C)
LAAVADHYQEIMGLNTEVLGISTDSIYAHKVFHETSPHASKVQFPLVADRTLTISRSYGVLDEQSAASYRATFIIDPTGKIRMWQIYPFEVGRNVEEMLRTLKALQYTEKTNEGTPADWKPGDKGIKADFQMAGKI